jgi:hypothetical protein
LIAQKATGNRGLFVCAIKKPFSMSGNALPKYFFSRHSSESWDDGITQLNIDAKHGII